MSTLHRIKAAFWWCYFHSEHELQPKRTFEVLPTDEMIEDGLHPKAKRKGFSGAPDKWGDVAVWDELHHRDHYFGGY